MIQSDRTVAGMPLAGLRRRALAKVVDAIFSTVCLSLVLGLGGVETPQIETIQEFLDFLTSEEQFRLTVIATIVGLVYSTFFVGLAGATPGKMLLGLRVVTGDGAPVGLGRALLRAMMEVISQRMLFLGYAIAPLDRQRRTLHDWAANTRVVRQPRE